MWRINIKLLSDDNLLMPERKNIGDSGFDLKASNDDVIRPGERKLIKCGFSIEMDKGLEGQVRSRSGLALKSGIFVLNEPGTIDSGYRNEVGVILANFSDKVFEVKKYDRIAQLVINEIPDVTLIKVDELSDSQRGMGGFGSTGVK